MRILSALAFRFLLWFISCFLFIFGSPFSVVACPPIFCRGKASRFRLLFAISFSVVNLHPVFYCVLESHFLLLFSKPFLLWFGIPFFCCCSWHPVFGFCLVSCFPLCFNIPFCVVIWHPIFCCDMVSRFLFFGIPLSVFYFLASRFFASSFLLWFCFPFSVVVRRPV